MWIIRLLFLKDVMSRYYDPRQVTIDLIANFYREQRADLVPSLGRDYPYILPTKIER
jgi:hypothetical protein